MANSSLILTQISEKHRQFYSSDIGRAALGSLQTDFPYPWLYIAELLQNAVDAGAQVIRIRPNNTLGELTFEHDGDAFEEEHVRALCSKGVSTKGARAVGFMGIGFKSIFHSYQRVDVSSGRWRFYLEVPVVIGKVYGDRQRDWLGSVCPKEDSEIDPPATGMKCRFILRKRLDVVGTPDDDIGHVLSGGADVLLPLLANRNVKSLEVGARQWTLSKDTPMSTSVSDFRTVVHARDEETKCTSDWIIFSAIYHPSKQATAEFLEHRHINLEDESLPEHERERLLAEVEKERVVDLFCGLDTGGRPLISKHPQLFALLSTDEDSPVGLDMQADWLLATTRRGLVDPTKPWHKEIFEQTPRLLRAFLEWGCTINGLQEEHLSALYGVFPDVSSIQADDTNDIWTPSVKKALTNALRTARFLPVRVKSGIAFLSPKSGRMPPRAFWSLDETRLKPWMVFGSSIISASILGERALACLQGLGLLAELRATDLVRYWEHGAVKRWMNELGELGTDALLQLLAALGKLDLSEDWQKAELRCLPPDSGGSWLHRGIVRRLPRDWDIIPDTSPNIKEILTPCLPPKDETLVWRLERELRTNAEAASYIKGVMPLTLDQLVSQWWASLSANPSESEANQVIDFTNWVRVKQRQRTKLVERVICENDTSLRLVPWREAALADPYANPARRRFFPDRLYVSAKYLQCDQSASAADWQSFFEAVASELAGRFVVYRSWPELSRAQLCQALPGYFPPDTRVTGMWPAPNWEGRQFSESNYLLFDYQFAPALKDVLAQGVTEEAASDIAQWLQEGIRSLLAFHKRALVYVPHRASAPERREIPFSSAWVSQLEETQWVWDQQGTGPHLPADLLSAPDPARPEAPVVRLPTPLVDALEKCGIDFGGHVPKISDLARLQREGTQADARRVRDLILAARESTRGDEDLQKDFLDILREVSLFPVPNYITLIDRAIRIPATRLITSRSRGDLGGWLLSIDQIAAGSVEQDLANLLVELLESSEQPMAVHALSFLFWVWRARPDAELVRRILPRAYALLDAGVKQGALSSESCTEIPQQAHVFTGTRKWSRVSDGGVYLDDVGDERLSRILVSRQIELATGGHLGATPEDQVRTAELLKLPQLSSRFRLIPYSKSDYPASQSWNNGFREIQRYLLDRVSHEDEEDTSFSGCRIDSLIRCAQLNMIALDDGQQCGAWNAVAACIDDKAIVAGEPIDFMAELCTQLVETYDLSLRRYIHSLSPEVTQLLGLLDEPDKLHRRIAQLRERYGLSLPGTRTCDQPGEMGDSGQHSSGPDSSGGASVPDAEAPVGDHGRKGAIARAEADRDSPATDVEQGRKLTEEELSVQSPGALQQESQATWTEERAAAHFRSMLDRSRAAGAAPPAEDVDDSERSTDHQPSQFGSDEPFRSAVLKYELDHKRFPMSREVTQPGYDIDSFTHPEGDPRRRLLRRIEVKGRNAEWSGSEIVELSSRQLRDAQDRKVEDDVPMADGFDYWLYVVEPGENGNHHVLPVRNPANRAAKYMLRGDFWRDCVEEE